MAKYKATGIVFFWDCAINSIIAGFFLSKVDITVWSEYVSKACTYCSYVVFRCQLIHYPC